MTVQGTYPVSEGPNAGLFSAFAPFQSRNAWLAEHQSEHPSRSAASAVYRQARQSYEDGARQELGLLTQAQKRDGTLANGADAARGGVPTYTPTAPGQSRPPVWYWIPEQGHWSMSPPEIEAAMAEQSHQVIITGEAQLKRRNITRLSLLVLGLGAASAGLIKLFGKRRN